MRHSKSLCPFRRGFVGPTRLVQLTPLNFAMILAIRYYYVLIEWKCAGDPLGPLHDAIRRESRVQSRASLLGRVCGFLSSTTPHPLTQAQVVSLAACWAGRGGSSHLHHNSQVTPYARHRRHSPQNSHRSVCAARREKKKINHGEELSHLSIL